MELSLVAFAESTGSVSGTINSVAPISIRFGDATRELVNQSFNTFGLPSQILILGDDSQSFFLGSQYRDDVRFISSNPEQNLRPYDPVRNPNGLDLSTAFLGRGISAFVIEPNTNALLPLEDGISGTVGGIAVRGSNFGLYGSVQRRVFERQPEPIIPEPIIPEPIIPDLASTQNLDVVSSNFCDDATVARSFDSDILDVDESLTVGLSINEASATANPCTSRSTPSQPGNTLEAPSPEEPETLESSSSDEATAEAVEESVNTSEAISLEESELLESESSSEGTSAALVEHSTEVSSENEGVIVEVPEAAIGVEPVVDAPSMNLSVETFETRPVFSSSPGQAL